METGAHDDGLAIFVSVRPRLFGIAYRMLGSAAEAEDLVQDVWLRWQTTNRSAVLNPPAFLATTITRLAINVAQSAHTRPPGFCDVDVIWASGQAMRMFDAAAHDLV